MSLYEFGSTVRSFEDIAVLYAEIHTLCEEVIRLLNKANGLGAYAQGLTDDLKKTGQLLFDVALTKNVKTKLKSTKIKDLIISIDESLVEIPWELLFDGEEFLSLKFNLGRTVKTRQKSYASPRKGNLKELKLLILADPRSDLELARAEAKRLREMLDQKKDKVGVFTKIKDIPVNYVKRNLRDYDIIHYAGHANFVENAPAKSGWCLIDGNLTGNDLAKMKGGPPFPLLIFSNACQSTFEKSNRLPAQSEEQVFGFANAFLLAGVKYFIGPLWKISDEGGFIFAQAFYQAILNGRSIGQALRRARLSIIEQEGQDRLTWASYVLYGEPTGVLLQNDDLLPTGGRRRESTGEPTVIRKLLMKCGSKRAIFFVLTLFAGLVGYQSFVKPHLYNVLARMTWNKAQEFYAKGDYVNTAKSLTKIIYSKESMQSPKDLYQYHVLIVNSYAMLNDYNKAILYGKRLLTTAEELAQSEKILPTYLILADFYYEEILFDSLFVRQSDKTIISYILDNNTKGAMLKLPIHLAEAESLYQKVLQGKPSSSIKARALQGLARIERMKAKQQEAIWHLQQAIDTWYEIKDLNPSAQQEVENIHLDLASCYIENPQTFDKASEQLGKLEKGLIHAGAEDEWNAEFADSMKRKFECFLKNVAGEGYGASEFYQKARARYGELF